jgi:hypothetical protein
MSWEIRRSTYISEYTSSIIRFDKLAYKYSIYDKWREYLVGACSWHDLDEWLSMAKALVAEIGSRNYSSVMDGGVIIGSSRHGGRSPLKSTCQGAEIAVSVLYEDWPNSTLRDWLMDNGYEYMEDGNDTGFGKRPA